MVPVFFWVMKAVSSGEGVGHFGGGAVGAGFTDLFPVGDGN